uniref:T cell receptor beta variable 29-1 n=1 Tax=Oryctolagus cuniculus TaxID=9986 RepID=A0A5F9D3I7_RABIT
MLAFLLLLQGGGFVFGVLVSQKPIRDICQRGNSIMIQCQVDVQASLMFWYRQLPGQSLILIATANQGSEATYESGFTKDKFPITRPNLTFSTLTVSDVSPEDNGLYLCSFGDTVLGTDQRSEQEPQLPPTQFPPNGTEGPVRVGQREETTALG